MNILVPGFVADMTWREHPLKWTKGKSRYKLRIKDDIIVIHIDIYIYNKIYTIEYIYI